MISFLELKIQHECIFPSPQASISEKQEDCGDKINFKKDFVDAGSSQRNTIRVSTVKNNIIIPSSRAVDEDLFFSLNFLGMAAVAT